MAVGLMLLAVLSAVPPEAPSIGSPRLARGDEYVYQGEVLEAGERVDNRFRKKHTFEVRLFVLEAADGTADCVVQTLVRPQVDPLINSPVVVVNAKQALTPSVRIELVRIDARGRVTKLDPPAGPPPLLLGPATFASPAPRFPLDSVPAVELGMFLPLPAKSATLGTTWEMADAGRPPIVWTAAKEAIWNGSRCLEVTAIQQTDGYDDPNKAFAGWKRSDVLWVSPGDGYASVVRRKVERREGGTIVGWVEVNYELRPPTRYLGTRYADARREAEAAYAFAAELAPLLPRVGKIDPQLFKPKLAKIDRFLADHPAPTGFRDAVESVRRRCEAATRGESSPTPTATDTPPPDPPSVGRPAPDFVAHLVHSAGQFRPSAGRGRPAVLVFYRPQSRTGPATLAVAEALHAAYPARVTVAALAVSDSADVADRQRQSLRLTLPIADGNPVRTLYGIDTYPKFFVIDAAGNLAWQFDGYGPETGYLVKEELETLLKPTVIVVPMKR